MGSKQGPTSKKLPPPPTPCSPPPRLSKEIKMQVTPSNAILLRLSVTQFAEPLIIQQPLLLPPHLPPPPPFSSLPLNYWWPWLQAPHPSHTSRTVTLPCPHHAILPLHERARLFFSAQLCICVHFANSILTCTSTSTRVFRSNGRHKK